MACCWSTAWPSNNTVAQPLWPRAVQFLPMPLVYLALIPVVTAIARRTGPRAPMTAGLVLMGTGMLLYSAAGPNASLWLLEAALALTRAGLASGVVNLARL